MRLEFADFGPCFIVLAGCLNFLEVKFLASGHQQKAAKTHLLKNDCLDGKLR